MCCEFRRIYCITGRVKSLRGQYHPGWNFRTVRTRDKLSLGTKELILVEWTMLHWSEKVFCYPTGDDILFSNEDSVRDCPSKYPFNDLCDQTELVAEYLLYRAYILAPFTKATQ